MGNWKRYYVTYSLLVINVFCFKALIPENFPHFALGNNWDMVSQRAWTVFTYMFLHGDLYHLILNMFMLLSFGSFCEEIIGKRRFLFLYLLSGVSGGILHVFFPFSAIDICVGSSGALYGLMLLAVVLDPGIKMSPMIFPFVRVPAYWMITIISVLFLVLTKLFGFRIANTVHFGGALFGLFYGLYLRFHLKVEQGR